MSMPLGWFVAMTCTITLRVVTLTGSTCRVRSGLSSCSTT